MRRTILVLTIIMLLTAPVCHADGLEWISVADGAYLPDEAAATASYPASVTLGEQAYDLDSLLTVLLGEDYLTIERGEYDYADKYRSSQGDDPWEWRVVRIYDDGSPFMPSFDYNNPWITGERGGEYEAPRMTNLPEEGVENCVALLEGILPAEWLTQIDQTRWIRDRWDYSDRWMTDEEYESFCREHKQQYFTFNHVTEAGIPIQSEQIMAIVGMDGLSGLSFNRHEYTESDEQIVPMPLEEALKMANGTRSAKCTLLSAQLVYSNWLTEGDTHNLSWLLTTDAGTYVVDCVLNKHMCDSYEY